MLFNNSNTSKKAKEEHINKTLNALASGKFMTPNRICQVSGLSLTAVKCALEELFHQDKLEIIRQSISPKLRVKLKKGIIASVED